MCSARVSRGMTDEEGVATQVGRFAGDDRVNRRQEQGHGRQHRDLPQHETAGGKNGNAPTQRDQRPKSSAPRTGEEAARGPQPNQRTIQKQPLQGMLTAGSGTVLIPKSR